MTGQRISHNSPWENITTEQKLASPGAYNDPHSTGNDTFCVWVVIWGKNLQNLNVQRYAQGTTVQGGVSTDRGPGFGGAGAKPPHNAITRDGPGAHEVKVGSGGFSMIIADAPGFGGIPTGLAPADYPVSFHANFEVVATSNVDQQVKADIWYDFNMTATAIGPNGVTQNEMHTTEQTPGLPPAWARY